MCKFTHSSRTIQILPMSFCLYYAICGGFNLYLPDNYEIIQQSQVSLTRSCRCHTRQESSPKQYIWPHLCND